MCVVVCARVCVCMCVCVCVCLCLCVCFSSANKCLLKVGHYSAQMEQYAKAIEIYEQVTANSVCVYVCVMCLF